MTSSNFAYEFSCMHEPDWWKPDADQKPDIVETRAKHMANDRQAAA